MSTERTLRERFRLIATATEAAILPYLQTIDPTIQQLHFEYGHPLTIINKLQAMNNPQSYQFMKYPLLAVFEDVPERGIVDDISTISPRIIIANQTRPEYTREERDTTNFKPILLPIYDAFMRELKRTPYMRYDYRKPGERIMRPFWGKEGLYGNEGNVFGDALDCIEIRGAEFTIRRGASCLPASFKNF